MLLFLVDQKAYEQRIIFCLSHGQDSHVYKW